MKAIFLILLFCMTAGCTPKAEKKKYRIPYGFKGQVFIFFNRADGAEKKYENGFRIYDIPTNGILKTQFSPNFGYLTKGEFIYVYVDSLGNETELKPYARDNFNVDKNEVYITAEETGGGGVKNEYQYETFIVKTVSDSLTLVNRNPSLMDSILRKADMK